MVSPSEPDLSTVAIPAPERFRTPPQAAPEPDANPACRHTSAPTHTARVPRRTGSVRTGQPIPPPGRHAPPHPICAAWPAPCRALSAVPPAPACGPAPSPLDTLQHYLLGAIAIPQLQVRPCQVWQEAHYAQLLGIGSLHEGLQSGERRSRLTLQ